MDMSRFTESQIAKAKACKDQNELMELAKSEGVELTDEDLDAITGGERGLWEGDGKKYYHKTCGTEVYWASPARQYRCPKCNKEGLDLNSLDYR